MRCPLLSPTLLALMAVCSLQAEDAGARDAHFEAVRSLIDAEIQDPAAREISGFTAANYPDSTWFQKYLEWDFADRFHTVDPTKVDAMGKEINAGIEANTVPEAVKKAFKGGGGTMWRMVQELGKRFINPDAPPPLVGAGNLAASEKDQANRLVKGILVACDSEWKEALAKVKDSDELFNMPETDKRYKPLFMELTNQRYDAVHVLWKAHIVLREVMTRGADFGIDPQPVNEYFAALLAKYKEDISKWDYDFGDSYIPLKADVNTLLAEGVRQKVDGLNADDIEGEIFKVLDYDLKPFTPDIRDQFIDLQLRTWSSLLRWHLEMGDDRSVRRGLEDFQQLQDRLKDLPVKLNSDTSKALSLASCLITAARLHMKANNSSAANSLLAQVSGARLNPQSGNAQNWIAGGVTPSKNQNEWAERPEAQDPQQVLSIAQAFIEQATTTDDAKQSHQLYMHAAVALRNGILGLFDGYEDEFTAAGPALYERYAYVLYRLDMHFHAAVAAEEGLQAILARISPKENPWRNHDKDHTWTDDGMAVKKLAKNAQIYASGLRQRSTSKSMMALQAEIIDLASKAVPESGGDSSRKTRLQDLYNSGSYDECIAGCKEYLAEKKDDYDVYGYEINAYMAKYEQANKPPATPTDPQVAAIANELRTLSSEMVDRLNALKGPGKGELTSDQKKAYSAAISTPVFINYSQNKFAEVRKALNSEFWRSAPSDQGLRARMLRYLCMSEMKGQEAVLADAAAKQDPKTYATLFPELQGVYAIYGRQSKQLTDDEVQKPLRSGGKALAKVYNTIQKNCQALVGANVPGSDKLLPIITDSRRALADLLYTDLIADPKVERGNLLAVAGLLWEMDSHDRAANLYALYLRNLASDVTVQDFKRNPKPILDRAEAQVVQRPELRDAWKVIRDLLEDGPEVEDYRNGVIPREKLTEEPIDCLLATDKLRSFPCRHREDARTDRR